MEKVNILLSNGDRNFIEMAFQEFEKNFLDDDGNFKVPVIKMSVARDSERSVVKYIFTKHIVSIEEA